MRGIRVAIVRSLVGMTVAAGLVGAAAPAQANGTPCGFDLFVLSDGVARELTSTPFRCEFRPEWSPSRRHVVHNDSGGVGLFIVDVETGGTTFVAGSDNGNNPNWSPGGQLISFDRVFYGDPTVYALPPEGGVPVVLATDAVDADWGPSGQRIAFVRPSDGSIRTVAIDGAGETIIAPAGSQAACLPIECGLAWSPNGQYVAFSDGHNIWTVRVTPDGAPLAEPALVAAGGPFFLTQLTWSGDSKSIGFNSDLANDGGWALWTVRAAGGVPSRLEGTTSRFTFDPHIARGGGAIVYSGSRD